MRQHRRGRISPILVVRNDGAGRRGLRGRGAGVPRRGQGGAVGRPCGIPDGEIQERHRNRGVGIAPRIGAILALSHD